MIRESILLLAMIALAEGGGNIINPDISLVVIFVLFIIFVFLLNRLLFRPIGRVLDKREALTEGATAEARAAAHQYNARLSEYESTIRRARAEGYRKLEQQRSAELEARRALIEGIKEEASAEIERAKSSLAEQAAEARAALEAESRQLAENLAHRARSRSGRWGRLIVISSILLLLLAADSAASGGFLWNKDIWKVINLLIFVLILVYIFRNKIKIGQVFDDRASVILKDLEQARRDKEQAVQQLAQVESRLNRLDQEIAEIRAESEREAAREAERIRAAAAADAEKIRQTAQREIEGAVKAARMELRAFVAERSVEMAESMIRRDIRPEDNHRMLEKYVDEMREVNR